MKFNTIDNASEKEDNNQGYSDFKSIQTEVVINESYDLTVNVNTDGQYQVVTKVWFDWNQNCSFNDPGEEYDLGMIGNVADGPTDNSPLAVVVPENAILGTTTMRVSTAYTDPDEGQYATACQASFDGEVEDYSLVVKKASIKDAVFDEFNLFPNPSDGTFNLSFATKEKNDVSVQLFDLAGRLVDSKYFNNSSTYFTRDISFNVKSGGLYLLKITNNNKYTTRKLIIK